MCRILFLISGFIAITILPVSTNELFESGEVDLSGSFQKPNVAVPIREFLAVSGGEARLPCNFIIPKDPEVISLILWYRHKSPVYTLDFRKGRPEEAKHFPFGVLEGRSFFDTKEYPPTLKIDPVKLEDEGVYKCRIEYRRARTLTRAVKLVIIVPPQAVAVMDERGQRLKRLAGPYDEGAYLALLCEAEGGNPSPAVTWWRGGILLDDTYFRTAQGFVRNELVILELRRTDHMVELTCQATNTNLTAPINVSVSLDLNMRPQYVRITTQQRPLKVGDDVRLDCETSGSRPPAKIAWWVDGKSPQSGRQSFFTKHNVTYSSIHLSTTIEDNGKAVVCRADNPTLPHSMMQDTWYLNIYFPPEVRLQLGANIKFSTIREGNDVYLECIIRANPTATELTWFFESVPFFGNTSAGVIISNQSLVLQKVRKEHRGTYKCSASNTEGQGNSMNMLLEVRYAPTCHARLKKLYGVSRGESVNISCEVESDPREVSFRWALNNSVESVPLLNFSSRGTSSLLTYTPRTMLEYGAVLCWARNVVGESKEPCVVRVIPAGPPDPVRNCVVSNRTRTYLAVDCEAGYNGGLPQKFHMDVYNSAVDHLHSNASAVEVPSFAVTHLPPGTPFVLVVYATNEKGKSNTVALLGSTLSTRDAEAEAALAGNLTPLVAVVTAAVGTLLVVAGVAIALLQLRKKKPRKAEPSVDDDKAKNNKCSKKPFEEKEENPIACPDVVPPNNVCDSESLESAKLKDGQSPDSAKCSRNYRNCVVALKRSWSLKKRNQEKSEIEVSLADLSFRDDITHIPLSPTTIVQSNPWIEDGASKSTLLSAEDHADEMDTHRTVVPHQNTTLL